MEDKKKKDGVFPALQSRNADLVISPGPWPGCGAPSAPCTAPELNMLGMLGSVRDKPNWQEKAVDKKIRDKWRAEMLASKVHTSQVEWVLKELEDNARKCPNLSPVRGVYQSDTFIGENLR